MNSESRQEIRPDICVIGAGVGGQAAAAAGAAFGVNVVLIDKGGGNGGAAGILGDGIHGGALPSQALLAVANCANTFRNGGRFGIKSVRFGVDFAAVRNRVHDVTAAVAPLASRQRFEGLGVRVIEGAARFTGRDTVAVNGYDIKARRFVVATGASPALPAIPGLADTPHFTSATIFDLAECPRHLIVIGAGVVGLELAQAFRRLGAAVTVLEAATPLAGDDPECVGIVLDALEREGVVIRSGVQIKRLRHALARVQAEIATDTGEEKIEGTHILVAAGHRPNIEELDLDAGGITYQPNGIVVDRRLRTSNARVYAVGEATGAPPFAHVAHHHAGLVVRNALFRTPVNADRYVVPLVTYTDPELAHVGLNEDEARAHSGIIRVLRSPYRANGRAQATGATNGHIKIVTDRRGSILGATIVGAAASENIVAWELAINQKLNIEALAGVIVPYPTYAEVGKHAAMTYFTRGLTSPLVRRIIGWLRRFG
jgi:pyruvate/2-oxoglutarate dehydrogenase complex dihydrolipoamide dehydrogenase (E3) component